MSFTVHHLNNSRSLRIVWLLEELGAEYEIKQYMRDPKTMRGPSSLREVHALGKAPCVSTPDGEVLAESGYIIERLIELHDGKLAPQPDTPAYRRYRYFLHYAEGSLMPPLLVKLITGKLRGKDVPFIVRPIAKAIASQIDGSFTDGEILRNLTFVNDELETRPFFAGAEFSGADIQMSFPLQAAASRGPLNEFPNIVRFLETIETRDAYQRAIERGGELDLG